MIKTFANAHLGMQNIDMSISAPKYEPTAKPTPKVKQDKILDVIFAADETGFPTPAASIALERSTDPVVREYIQRILLQKISSPVSVEDANTALELSQQFGESAEDYAARITDYVAKINKIGPYAESKD